MPEQDEVDTPQSGEPPPENESKPAVQPDPVGQAVSLPEESQPGQVERQDAAHGVELPGESQPGQVELQDVAQGVGLPGEPQPGQVELQAERPEPRRLSRGERETVDGQRRRFAACGRCGYFIADCQNQLGVEAVQTALLDTTDGWVHLKAYPSFHRRVMDAYGVQLDAAFDSFDGTCPECRRRFVVENAEDGSTYLKLHV